MKQKKEDSGSMKPVHRFVTDVLIIVILIWLLWGTVLGAVQIKDMDMSPDIKQKDLAVYYRLNSEYHAQDAVIIKKNDIVYSGRIAAVSGDEVGITEAGNIIINGSVTHITDESYKELAEYPVTLGEDEYFILYEKYSGLKEPDFFGKVSRKDIQGKIITLIRKDNI